MRAMLRNAVIGVVLVGVVVAVLWIWAYRPVPSFEPVAYEPRAPSHWPTHGWRLSTPEQQGMSSEMLLDLQKAYEAAALQDPELYVDSMTIIRNGTLVADFYNNPLYPRDELHVVHSVTKSIVSVLVGIAIEKGYIDGVDVRLVDLFPDRRIQNLDERKQRLAIRDLLSMQTGLHSRDSYLYAHDGLFALQHSPDWVEFALDLPMAAEPGERFDYSNISTFLLGVILQRTTGEDPLDFAREHLFGPLGIDDVRWEWNSEGQPIAWARMWLKPNDLAKIGLLFLRRGEWEGEQLVPASWVRESVTPWAYPPNAVDVLNADMSRNRDASRRGWISARFFRPFSDGYGYQWWLDRDGTYAAMGTSGQFLIVAPEQGLVFVAMSKSQGLAQFVPARLFEDFVLRAVLSDSPLAENPLAVAELRALAGPPTLVETVFPVPELPETAARISGATYRMESNPFNTDRIRFVFDPEQDYAELSYTARESWDVRYRIGLDGVRRFTETKAGVFAAVGEWASDDTFAVDVEIVGYSTFDRWEFTFDQDAIRVTEFSISGDYAYQGQVK